MRLPRMSDPAVSALPQTSLPVALAPSREEPAARPARAEGASEAAPTTWLIGDVMDRERMLEMDRMVAPVRRKSFVVMAVALLLCGPWLGWWTILLLAVAGVLFAVADKAIERVRRPEYLLFAAWAGS